MKPKDCSHSWGGSAYKWDVTYKYKHGVGSTCCVHRLEQGALTYELHKQNNKGSRTSKYCARVTLILSTVLNIPHTLVIFVTNESPVYCIERKWFKERWGCIIRINNKSDLLPLVKCKASKVRHSIKCKSQVQPQQTLETARFIKCSVSRAVKMKLPWAILCLSYCVYKLTCLTDVLRDFFKYFF